MAMQSNFKSNDDRNRYGVDFPKSYFRIENLIMDIDRGLVRAHIRAYADEKACRKAKDAILNGITPSVVGVHKNVVEVPLEEMIKGLVSVDQLKQAAYEYIKTTDGYTGMKDV